MNVMKGSIYVISMLHVRTQLEVMSVTASVDSQGMVSTAPVSHALHTCLCSNVYTFMDTQIRTYLYIYSHSEDTLYIFF